MGEPGQEGALRAAAGLAQAAVSLVEVGEARAHPRGKRWTEVSKPACSLHRESARKAMLVHLDTRPLRKQG